MSLDNGRRCALEVLETMTLDPRVSNWMAEGNDDFPGHPGIAMLLQAKRSQDGYNHARERTHLMFMYHALCQVIMCRDLRLRNQVQRLLLLTGTELAIVSNTQVPEPTPNYPPVNY